MNAIHIESNVDPITFHTDPIAGVTISEEKAKVYEALGESQVFWFYAFDCRRGSGRCGGE